jgi:GntR family transcriptional repressor for pyruvate dehydrogenase complex
LADAKLFQTVGVPGRLVDRVVEEIEQSIISGRLKPGMKLPPERALTEELGVSRTVVREAIQILSAKGLLAARSGVGTIVRQVTRKSVLQSVNLLLQTNFEGVTYEHLLQVRTVLDIEIAGLAAQHATEADVAHLRQILNEMERAKHVPEAIIGFDTDLHHKLASMTGNPLLIIFIDLIWDLMEEETRLVIQYVNPERDIIAVHPPIVEKIAARDVAGARQAAQLHAAQTFRNHETTVRAVEQKGAARIPEVS